jgi:hypothetical protein
MRGRLRSLFVATDEGDAVAELIAEHSRELDARAAELRAAVEELEERETRAREHHARVERVLREGSAELDVRHSDLTERAHELDRRDAALVESEARVAERARELGAVELRSAAVERREQALREREIALARREQSLRDLEARRELRPVAPEGTAPDGRDEHPRAPAEIAHVAFAIDNGYRLVERDGAAPSTGETVDLDGEPHRCIRVSASPFPDDPRRCAVLERLPPPPE